MTCTATLPISQPASRTRRAVSVEEGDPGGAGPLGLRRAEVRAEVAEPGRREEGVAGGVRGDVGVRVTLEPGRLVRPGQAGEVHRDARHEPVDVGADADAGLGDVSGL